MLLYTGLPYDVFAILLSSLQRFTLTYYCNWTPISVSLADQLLMTLITKLKMSCKDADLAFRFDCSTATVGNIFLTLVHALHKLLYDGIMDCAFPTQLKCKESMPKAFDEFASARASINAIEIEQDIPRGLERIAVTNQDIGLLSKLLPLWHQMEHLLIVLSFILDQLPM